ncbi:jg11971 [Pararge aegeria aegeria]|uniref:Jg11971 protein n=1 Tax=Pararge aegeria aegeria TaxID=348720 RepID=A0A8S4SHF0_9NEOP|nr:jg11971 [Pararge aegeria aegeria]
MLSDTELLKPIRKAHAYYLCLSSSAYKSKTVSVDHRQAQMQANQTNQSSDQPTNQSTNQPPNQQDPDDGRNSRTTSATFTKSAMTSNSSIIRRPIPPIRAGTKSSEPLLKSAFRSKSSTLEFK